MIPTMPLVTADLATSIVEETAFEKHKLVIAPVSDANSLNQQLIKAQTERMHAQQRVEIDALIAAQQDIDAIQRELGLIGTYISAEKPNPLKPNRMQNYFSKPQFFFGLPPSCNVFFPSQIKILTYNENYADQPTRLYYNDEVLNRALAQPNDGLGSAVMNALAVGYPPEVDAAIQARDLNPKTTGKNFLLYPEEFYKGPVMDRRPIPQWLYFLKQDEKTKAGQQTKSGNAPNSAETPTDSSAANQDLFEKLKVGHPDVYRAYTAYEFYRERYAKRSGAVILAWNPYVVPGFPIAVFDQRATRVDLFAYATTVQMSMSHRSRSTTVTFMYARTIQEMFDIMATLFAEGAPSMATGPREPIQEIRQTIQSFDQAEAYYRKLFFGNRQLFGKDAACDWRKLIAYASANGLPPQPIFVTGGDEKAVKSYNDASQVATKTQPALNTAKQKLAEDQQQLNTANATITGLQIQSEKGTWTTDQAHVYADAQTAKANYEKLIAEDQAEVDKQNTHLSDALGIVNDAKVNAQTTVTHNLVGDRELIPTRAAASCFTKYDDAIRYNWRPRCTLDEYIIFHNSKGEGPVPAFGQPRSVGARYYMRIRRMVPLTADTILPTGTDGLTTTTVANPDAAKTQPDAAQPGDTNEAPSTQSTVPALPANFPNTRADWDSILIAYRDNVYKTISPGY